MQAAIIDGDAALFQALAEKALTNRIEQEYDGEIGVINTAQNAEPFADFKKSA
jgi:hypothetical protein